MPAVEINEFSTPNFSSSHYTQKFSPPNCTWYAYGRASEYGGKPITFSQDYGLNAEVWWTAVNNYTQSRTPAENSIAVWKDGQSGVGHVAFVYGKQGSSILFSDSNFGRKNTSSYSMPQTEFEAMCLGSKNFCGYLVP